MSRDAASRKLSDSDFWQICREMHSANGSMRVPSTTALGVPNGLNSNMTDSIFDGDMFDLAEIEALMSNDDNSLENLYAKQKVAHQKLLVANGNSVNTQKILDTIQLIYGDENMTIDNDNNGNVLMNGISAMETTPTNQITTHNHNEIDAINNADDLLLEIADSVQQLKANVNQIDAQRTGPTTLDADLIDFSDEWLQRNKHGESANNRCRNDNEVTRKKATQPASAGNFQMLMFRVNV